MFIYSTNNNNKWPTDYQSIENSHVTILLIFPLNVSIQISVKIFKFYTDFDVFFK